MTFRFPLQTLLRLREGMERQEELKLQHVIAMWMRAKSELERLFQERQAAWSEAKERLSASAAASELHFELARDEVIQQRAEILRLRIVELDGMRRQQQLAYQKARQDREILQNLRDRQREHHDVEQNRKEQQSIDDLQQMLRAASIAIEADSPESAGSGTRGQGLPVERPPGE